MNSDSQNQLLSAEEIAEFQLWKKQKEEKEVELNKRLERDTYKKITEQNIQESYIHLLRASAFLAQAKRYVLDTFKTTLEMKAELYGIKPDQKSNTFTSQDGKIRITIGNYMIDGYDDTVNEGIAIIKEEALSLIDDAKSKALVEEILSLVSKDQQGNLKPASVVKLRNLANKLSKPKMLDGISIVEASYRPTPSKTFIRCDFKEIESEEWKNLALGITEVTVKDKVKSEEVKFITQDSVLKLFNAGFKMIRKEDYPNICIKFQDYENQNWKTLDSPFDSKEARDLEYERLRSFKLIIAE